MLPTDIRTSSSYFRSVVRPHTHTRGLADLNTICLPLDFLMTTVQYTYKLFPSHRQIIIIVVVCRTVDEVVVVVVELKLIDRNSCDVRILDSSWITDVQMRTHSFISIDKIYVRLATAIGIGPPHTISLTIYLFDNYISLVTSSPSMMMTSSSSSSWWVFPSLVYLFFYSKLGNWELIFFSRFRHTQLIDMYLIWRKVNLWMWIALTKRDLEYPPRAIIMFFVFFSIIIIVFDLF